MSRKVDPSTPSPKIGGVGGSDGVKPSKATGWGPLVGDPLPPAEPEADLLLLPLLCDQRLLAAETPSPEVTD